MNESALDTIVKKLTALFPNGCGRILLINPPVIPEEEFDREMARRRRYPVFPPYGLGILNRELRKSGYETRITDLNYEVFAADADPTAWKKVLAESIAGFRPDLVAVTCMYSMTHPSLRNVAGYVKVVNPTLPVIAGGVHPTAAPEVVLRDCRGVDLVMLVEGDSAFPDLLACVNGKLPAENLRQVATLEGDSFVSIDGRKLQEQIDESPDFDDLPIGAYHQLGKIGAYHNILPSDVNASVVLSNRGCRGNCIFCSVKAFFGGGSVRVRDVDAVVDEMAALKENHSISHFMWLDDDLLFNETRALRLFRKIAERNLQITWDASNGVVASSITEELAVAMRDSGCIGLTLGIESGSADILRSIRKPSGLHHFRRAAEILQRHEDIFTKGFLMLGFLSETVAQIQETVNLARELNLDWYPIQILTPFPATGVRKQLEEEGVIDPDTVDTKFFLGSTGGQRKREADEKVIAKDFADPFTGDLQRVPTQEELKDLWFVMDYRVNYERILREWRPRKLEMLRLMLADICERVQENPLATMFLGIVEKRLGNTERSLALKETAKRYLERSDFWRKRFEALDLYPILKDAEEGAAA